MEKAQAAQALALYISHIRGGMMISGALMLGGILMLCVGFLALFSNGSKGTQRKGVSR